MRASFALAVAGGRRRTAVPVPILDGRLQVSIAALCFALALRLSRSRGDDWTGFTRQQMLVQIILGNVGERRFGRATAAACFAFRFCAR